MTMTRSQTCKEQDKPAEKASMEALKSVVDKKIGKAKSATKIGKSNKPQTKEEEPEVPPSGLMKYFADHRSELRDFHKAEEIWMSMPDSYPDKSRYIAEAEKEYAIYLKKLEVHYNEHYSQVNERQ